MVNHAGTGPESRKGERNMMIRRKSALVMAGMAVMVGVLAPAADALPNCQSSGTTSTCRTNGSVSIKGATRDSGSPREPARDPVASRPRRLSELWRLTEPGSSRVVP